MRIEDRDQIKNRLEGESRGLGFTLAGVAPAADADGFARFEAWLDAGHAGEMAYLPDRREARRHPRSVLDHVRSVVMLGMEYDGRTPPPPSSDRPLGRVAAYARGPDYHPFLRDRLNALAAWLTAAVPGSRSRGVTDTAPLLERDFARRAGLGWFGKNTMLINKHRGSFFLLAALLTTVDLPPDAPHAASHCGTCTACLDACPTGAFPTPGVLDARKCVSYLTIELRSAIPPELREGVGDRLFGCDVCQDVCPWNRHPSAGPVGFPADPELAALDPIELLGLTAAEFRHRFKGTSLTRAKRAGLLRNAAIVLGNVGDERALPALQRAVNDESPLVREAAEWAIARIAERTASSVGSLHPS